MAAPFGSQVPTTRTSTARFVPMTDKLVVPRDRVLAAPREGIEYLEHQVAGVRWMLEREAVGAPVCRGGVLADDMGLGKTFQTIGLLKNTPFDLRTLLICPPALLSGWTEELRACGFRVWIIGTGVAAWSPIGGDREEHVETDGSRWRRDVWLTTYSKAHLFARFLATEADGWGRVVLDEGHIIRNGKATQRWWSCLAIAKKSPCRWILSATPVQNGPDDWRNLCWWLHVRCPQAAIPALGPVIMLRRTMDELRATMSSLPVPPRFVDHALSIPESTAEGKLFRALCDNLQSVMDSRHVAAVIKLELYLRIQQFLVHPQLYIESMRRKFQSAYSRPDWRGGTAKWSAFCVELSRAVTERVPTIVFCKFSREIDLVVEEVQRIGGRVWSIRGGMGSEKVGEAVAEAKVAARSCDLAQRTPERLSDAVNSDDTQEPSDGSLGVVVVVQIESGGAGLNLQFCRRILFLSQHWNPAVVHQAVGRAVRIGQAAEVEIHRFNVVDEVMDNLDARMTSVHLRKIGDAREVCGTLYEGFSVGIPPSAILPPVDA